MGARQDLHGRVYAVTGGARGIGAATARALAAAGARVAVGDLDVDLAAESAREYGGLALPLDVTSAESFAAFLDKVEAEHGRLDGLVNNAGIMVIGRHLEVPLDQQLRQVDINLRGVILGSHAAAPRLVARGGGQIVNIASLAGRIVPPGSAVYSATKAAVIAFSEGLDSELQEHGVRVASVLPSFTSTGLVDGTTPPALSPPIAPEEVAEAIVGLMTRHRPIAVVPRTLGPTLVLQSLLPVAARRWIGRKSGMDAMFIEVDHEARADYERRTARS